MTQYPEPPHEEPSNGEQLIMLALLALGSATGGAVLAIPIWYAINGILWVVGLLAPAQTGLSVGFGHVWLYTALTAFVLLAVGMDGLQRSKRK